MRVLRGHSNPTIGGHCRIAGPGGGTWVCACGASLGKENLYGHYKDPMAAGIAESMLTLRPPFSVGHYERVR